MATPEVQSASPPRRRRWYQFSLRTLLIVMLLASIGMSWFAVKLQQARRQREAVEAIKKTLGGLVGYNYEHDANGDLTFDAAPPGPKWLRAILGEHFFAEVFSVATGFDADDATLESLAAMPNVRFLYLMNSTQITDNGLLYVRGLRDLQELDLSHTRVTDNGLRHLQELNRLEYLSLADTLVKGEGLRHLAGLSQLRHLVLSGNSINDTGVSHLEGLSQLQELELIHTHVTEGRVSALQRALPNCEIHWEPPRSPSK